MQQLRLMVVLFLLFGGAVESHTLHFSFVVSKTGAFVSSGIIPLVDYALQEINNRTDILSNYTLTYGKVLDSKCERRTSINLLMEKFFDNPKPTYIALVGCGCSIATIPVAQLSHYWNVPHITIASAASSLSDKSRFRSLFQILPSIDYLPATLTVFVKRVGWKQIAVITQQEALFIEMTHKLNLLFNEAGLILDDSVTLETGKAFPKETIFKWENGSDQRIIMLNTYSVVSYPIMCEAYKRGMLPPKYVWIFYDNPKNDWFDPTIKRACKPSEMDRILNGSLALFPEGYFVAENDSYVSTSGMRPSRFFKIHQYLLKQPKYRGLPTVGVEGPAYDAMWVMGLGLEEASKRIAANNDSGCETLQGELVPLELFSYDNPKMGCVLQESIRSIKINGISGPSFEFTKNKTRPGNAVIIYQFHVGENGSEREPKVPMIRVVNRNGIRDSSFFFFRPLSALWEKIPYDGYPQKKIRGYNIAVITILTLFGSAGIIFAVICFTFNTVFRRRKIVKLSSPNLNYILILGSVILYTDMFLIVFYYTGFDKLAKQTALCNFAVWFLSFGYVLCFSVILAKSGRVYYIFSNPNMKKKSIKDWMLCAIVAALTGVDVLILIIETGINSTRVRTDVVPDTKQFEAVAPDGMLINYYFFLCHQNVIFFGITSGYKALLQLVGIFFAFHTRKVKVKGLNESKQIGYIIYFNSILLISFVFTDYVRLQNQDHDVTVSVEAVTVFFQATLFLGLSFIPNMVSLYRDPKGETVFKDSGSNANNVKLGLGGANNAEQSKETEARMRARVKELEKEVRKLKVNVSKVSLQTATENTDNVNEEKEHYM